MRRYETILITHADLSEDELTGLTERYRAIITDQKGIMAKVERWGKRRLAYLIKKQSRGVYILLDYAGETAVVNELERNLKIHDKILKFMTILKEESVDPAALEKEIADAAQATKKQEEPQAAAPEAPPAVPPVEGSAIQPTEMQPTVPEESKTDAKGDH